ncbi:MAG: cysteine desulfurase [Lachnospira sp.]|nr:cysteine desulfurase [Lachnospira sp.]
MKSIYLDNAATTKLSQTTQKYLISILPEFGNPSSLHSTGQKAKKIISDARVSVAKFIHTTPENIYFTSGGSASNTLGIRGYYLKHRCNIAYSPIVHKSILKCVGNYESTYPLKVDKYGLINISDLRDWLNSKQTNPLVVIEYANSELGTIQNIEEIIHLIHLYNGIIYLDCTGSISTIPLDVSSLDVDMCGFSSHKLGGLKGCGVFYKKPDITIEPLIYGSQERELVGGTEDVLGIASLGKVAENYDYSSITPECRDYVYNYIIKNIPDSYLVGTPIGEKRLLHNLYICFKCIEGESLMILLDMNGIQVSTGSACNSGNLTTSTALSAIGINQEDIHSCIRMTFSGRETKEELDYVCIQLKKCVGRLRSLL